VSRWARASREGLEALAEECDKADRNEPHARGARLDDLRASCPPLRTEAEVAAEALAILRQDVRLDVETWLHRLRALAKEPTRG